MNILKQISVFPFWGLIKLYQILISPHLGHACRYTPSCSEYSIQALKKYGLIKGLYLSGKRIISCNPFGGSGYNPVI
jgi:putative membrane protein insertion efficiency factor